MAMGLHAHQRSILEQFQSQSRTLRQGHDAVPLIVMDSLGWMGAEENDEQMRNRFDRDLQQVSARRCDSP